MTTRNKQQNKNHTLPKRLAISAAVAATFLAGYGGRQAYAGRCTGAVGTYICSGAADAGTHPAHGRRPTAHHHIGPATGTRVARVAVWDGRDHRRDPGRSGGHHDSRGRDGV